METTTHQPEQKTTLNINTTKESDFNSLVELIVKPIPAGSLVAYQQLSATREAEVLEMAHNYKNKWFKG